MPRGPFGWRRGFLNRGRRMTVPRQAIFEVISGSRKHLSAEDIYMAVHKNYPGIGLTTVYRTLDILSEAGIVSKFDFGDGRARYEFIRGDSGNHCHAVCSSCGRVFNCEDFDAGTVKLEKAAEKLLKKSGFKVAGYRLNFYGLCENCRKREGVE